MKSLQKKSVFAALVSISLLLGGCSSGAKKDAGSAADSLMDDAAQNLSLELNGSSDDSTAGPLKTVFFDFDSSSLSSSARNTLEENAKYLKLTDQVDIQLEGHADERGGHQYNLALGERRARAVKEYLTALGVADSRISIISYGKEKPISFGHDDSSWSQNRRANFVITSK